MAIAHYLRSCIRRPIVQIQNGASLYDAGLADGVRYFTSDSWLAVVCSGRMCFSEAPFFLIDIPRVRAGLNDMAFDRWWTEARIWGHGIVENGPHHVEYMPIGSHHTWLGLLFVKGAVGFLALFLAMVWTTLDLAFAAQARREARAGLAVIFVMWFFSFSENLEMLAYLYWPGLVAIGVGLKLKTR